MQEEPIQVVIVWNETDAWPTVVRGKAWKSNEAWRGYGYDMDTWLDGKVSEKVSVFQEDALGWHGDAFERVWHCPAARQWYHQHQELVRKGHEAYGDSRPCPLVHDLSCSGQWHRSEGVRWRCCQPDPCQNSFCHILDMSCFRFETFWNCQKAQELQPFRRWWHSHVQQQLPDHGFALSVDGFSACALGGVFVMFGLLRCTFLWPLEPSRCSTPFPPARSEAVWSWMPACWPRSSAVQWRLGIMQTSRRVSADSFAENSEIFQVAGYCGSCERCVPANKAESRHQRSSRHKDQCWKAQIFTQAMCETKKNLTFGLSDEVYHRRLGSSSTGGITGYLNKKCRKHKVVMGRWICQTYIYIYIHISYLVQSDTNWANQACREMFQD